jgi:hypothetical protein
VQALQTELMVPCRVWNPLKPVQAEVPADQTEELNAFAPQLAVALGAAISVL